MLDKELFAKNILLSNGAEVPMSEVVSTMLALEALAAGERPLLRQLREACLGRREIPKDKSNEFIELGLAGQDGSIVPSVRAVVLAAVHGNGDNLYIASPYTKDWDRVVATLIQCKARVRTTLEEQEAEALISSADLLGLKNTLKELRSWVDRTRSHDDFPPPSIN